MLISYLPRNFPLARSLFDFLHRLARIGGIKFLVATAEIVTCFHIRTSPALAVFTLTTIHFYPPFSRVTFRFVARDRNLFGHNFTRVALGVPSAAFFLFKKVGHAVCARFSAAYVAADGFFVYNFLRDAIRVVLPGFKVMLLFLPAPSLDRWNRLVFRDALVARWMARTIFQRAGASALYPGAVSG